MYCTITWIEGGPRREENGERARRKGERVKRGKHVKRKMEDEQDGKGGWRKGPGKRKIDESKKRWGGGGETKKRAILGGGPKKKNFFGP